MREEYYQIGHNLKYFLYLLKSVFHLIWFYIFFLLNTDIVRVSGFHVIDWLIVMRRNGKITG